MILSHSQRLILLLLNALKSIDLVAQLSIPRKHAQVGDELCLCGMIHGGLLLEDSPKAVCHDAADFSLEILALPWLSTPAQRLVFFTSIGGQNMIDEHDACLPPFHYQGVVLDYQNLRYCPHPDIIFPSVIRTDGLRQPLGRYYCYYAPHDAPGGLCLAYADAPAGPWVEYPANPLIGHDWPPHYTVSHVSSPHAIWNEEAGLLYLYFHGENDITRFAVADDGVHFRYGGIAVTTGMLGEGFSEASYARVFRHPIAGTDTRYVMTFMANERGTRKVFLACSPEGESWHVRREPLLAPPPGTDQMGPGWLFPFRERTLLIAFANRSDSCDIYDPLSDLYLYTVDDALHSATFHGMLMDHRVIAPDNARISDPCLLLEEKTLYLFINVGRRLNQRIGLAVASVE